jgi:hypothetical protein
MAAAAVAAPDTLLAGILCPLTGELPRDPVTMVEDGQTYERAAIEAWIDRGHLTAPTASTTGRRLASWRYVPNFALRRALAELPPALLQQQAPATATTTRLAPVPEAGGAAASASKKEEEEERKDEDEEPAALRRALDAAEARMAPWHRYQMNPALGGQWVGLC